MHRLFRTFPNYTSGVSLRGDAGRLQDRGGRCPGTGTSKPLQAQRFGQTRSLARNITNQPLSSCGSGYMCQASIKFIRCNDTKNCSQKKVMLTLVKSLWYLAIASFAFHCELLVLFHIYYFISFHQICFHPSQYVGIQLELTICLLIILPNQQLNITVSFTCSRYDSS
jgi:hypothetical protein